MLDKVVLCKEGQEIYTGLKNHTYSLQESSVQVYLVSGSISESDLSLVTFKTLSGLEKTELTSKHSMLTELHVVAYGVAGGTTKGHYIALVIGGATCLAIAYSQEEMTGNEKLFLTFDFEETKGVLTAKADFDGNITQGILEEILAPVAKTGSYNDLSNTPEIPKGANDARVTVYAGGSIVENQASGGTEVGSFTVNQVADSFLHLGSASVKSVDATIGSESSDNLPTSNAVKSYVSGQIGTGSLTINKGGTDNTSTSFSANANAPVTINLGLGSAADLSAETSSLSASDNTKLPTSKVVADYVGAQGFLTAATAGISDHSVTIYRNSTNDTASLGSFTLNQNSDAQIELGFGDVVTHDAVSQISSSDSSSSSIPTAGAVVGYVGTGVLTIQRNSVDVGTFSANASSASTINIDVPTKLSELTDENGVLSSIPGYAEYDSSTKKILFKKDANSTTLFDVDATAFVKDGMVSNVEISNGNLVVSFNTDAGKQPISIPLTDIFNPSNYYTSSQTDSAISTAITNLQLGAASKKNVDSSITSTSSDNLPTTSAVTTYINDQGFAKSNTIGDGTIVIKKNSSDSGFSFTLNQVQGDTLDLGLGSAAYLASESTLDASSSNLPTSSAVASYIRGLNYLTSNDIGNSELKIKKHASDTNAISTGFTANAKQDVTVELGFGDAADKTVDTSITVTGSDTNATAGDNLPTSEAVRAFVEGKGYLTSVSNETIALAYNNPALGANQTSEFGTFTLNGTANRIVFGSAAHAETVYLSGTETIDTVQNQDTHLISLGQAKTLVSNATELKTVAPSDAPMTSGTQTGNGIEIPVGAMVWLALNFSGSVGIMDFTTVSSNADGTPLLSGNGTNAQLVAYMAQIRDNAGDFYALENQKLAAGQKFRTTNCMDSSGMAVPSYGFALCVRLPDDSSSTNTNG